ncbi:hypothetical protein [Bdellovibrio svalbardensis]|uniref:Uncharacterized protein n=1 Tax=Bdellovibrio svalbardensis TaxID=2972972 RepID=A0ABT6DFU5_9BACT|nr:hypothetical protein [Bdellovibrio svalbardensis]MDG0814819.1 hypothetical protein [Bdellovibrio svalbardensis]
MLRISLKQPFFTILLAVEILYLALALMIPPLPGWKMFSHVDWVESVSLKDDRGHEVPLRGYLPETYYDFSASTAQSVATFICKKHQEIPHWILQVERESYELQASDCIPRKK